MFVQCPFNSLTVIASLYNQFLSSSNNNVVAGAQKSGALLGP